VEVAARLELYTWMLAGDRAKRQQFTSAIAEKLALLYGGVAGDYQSAADAFAQSGRLIASKDWSRALQAESSAWRRLREILTARSTTNPAQ
jgi:hypothetical protein